MDTRRLVPNLLTLGNLLSGATALALLTVEAPPGAILICLALALAFDLLDGRVARALRVDNPFGVQLDSLADLVSFGVVPAVALWQWKLAALGWFAAPLAGLLPAAAAWRLARFNVAAAAPAKIVRGAARSTGLPVTFPAALLIAGAVAFPELPSWAAAALCPALAVLMVGRLPYRTFKDRCPSLLLVLVAPVALAALLVSATGRPFLPVAVALGALAYIASAPFALLLNRARRS